MILGRCSWLLQIQPPKNCPNQINCVWDITNSVGEGSMSIYLPTGRRELILPLVCPHSSITTRTWHLSSSSTLLMFCIRSDSNLSQDMPLCHHTATIAISLGWAHFVNSLVLRIMIWSEHYWECMIFLTLYLTPVSWSPWAMEHFVKSVGYT